MDVLHTYQETSFLEKSSPLSQNIVPEYSNEWDLWSTHTQILDRHPLYPYYFKCEPSPRALEYWEACWECRTSDLTQDPLNQKPYVNKIPKWFMCTVKFEKCCCTWWHIEPLFLTTGIRILWYLPSNSKHNLTPHNKVLPEQYSIVSLVLYWALENEHTSLMMHHHCKNEKREAKRVLNKRPVVKS